jgi:aspartyl-tRNA(Asn)/glutamyl-tRNA(Gln) amidotransferase subunit C
MNIDKETLQKIAHLARLEIRPENEEKMIKDLSSIVNFVEQLNKVNTDGVEPLTTMSQEINAFRTDEVRSHLSREDGLINAPSKDDEFFRVPKVIE